MTSAQAITLCVCLMLAMVGVRAVVTSPMCIECGGKIRHRRGCKRGAP